MFATCLFHFLHFLSVAVQPFGGEQKMFMYGGPQAFYSTEFIVLSRVIIINDRPSYTVIACRHKMVHDRFTVGRKRSSVRSAIQSADGD